jgi:3-oxoadipate enol-lactonase
MSERFISRPDGARLRIIDHAARLSVPADKAPTLVLSNSLATDASLWDDVIARIGSRVRLIGYDTRGHGASTSPAASTTLAVLADDLFAVMDACGVDKAFIAGISLGGMTGQQCALTKPQRLLGLIACNCRASIDAAGIAGWEQRLEVLRTGGIDALATITLERWFTPEYRAANPTVIERVRDIIRTTSPIGYEACVRAIQALDLLDAITDIQMPVLLVAGEQDAAASPAAMQAMQKVIPGARLEVLDPCGHLSSVQRPDDLAILIEDFISETEASR